MTDGEVNTEITARLDWMPRYALLEPLLHQRGLQLLAIYKIGDAALLFGVSPRTLHDWIGGGRLRARDLPGRGRFLPQDLEDFLAGSIRGCRPPKPETQRGNGKPRKRGHR